MTDDEKRFLHDISTPVATTLFLIEIISEDSLNQKPTDPDCVKRLQKAVTKIRSILEKRKLKTAQ